MRQSRAIDVSTGLFVLLGLVAIVFLVTQISNREFSLTEGTRVNIPGSPFSPACARSTVEITWPPHATLTLLPSRYFHVPPFATRT